MTALVKRGPLEGKKVDPYDFNLRCLDDDRYLDLMQSSLHPTTIVTDQSFIVTDGDLWTIGKVETNYGTDRWALYPRVRKSNGQPLQIVNIYDGKGWTDDAEADVESGMQYSVVVEQKGHPITGQPKIVRSYAEGSEMVVIVIWVMGIGKGTYYEIKFDYKRKLAAICAESDNWDVFGFTRLPGFDFDRGLHHRVYVHNVLFPGSYKHVQMNRNFFPNAAKSVIGILRAQREWDLHQPELPLHLWRRITAMMMSTYNTECGYFGFTESMFLRGTAYKAIDAVLYATRRMLLLRPQMPYCCETNVYGNSYMLMELIERYWLLQHLLPCIRIFTCEECITELTEEWQHETTEWRQIAIRVIKSKAEEATRRKGWLCSCGTRVPRQRHALSFLEDVKAINTM